MGGWASHTQQVQYELQNVGDICPCQVVAGQPLGPCCDTETSWDFVAFRIMTHQKTKLSTLTLTKWWIRTSISFVVPGSPQKIVCCSSSTPDSQLAQLTSCNVSGQPSPIVILPNSILEFKSYREVIWCATWAHTICKLWWVFANSPAPLQGTAFLGFKFFRWPYEFLNISSNH